MTTIIETNDLIRARSLLQSEVFEAYSQMKRESAEMMLVAVTKRLSSLSEKERLTMLAVAIGKLSGKRFEESERATAFETRASEQGS